MDGKTWKYLLQNRGEPTLRFEPDFSGVTEEQRYIQDLPVEIAVFPFKKENNRADGFIVYGRPHANKDDWRANYGARLVIKYLIEKQKEV